MTNKDTIIGELCLLQYSDICSVEDLRDELRLNKECVFTARQYCDRRYSTNLQRFNYDPFTGEKIDWKKVKELLQ